MSNHSSKEKGLIYRIMDFQLAVDIFEKRQIYFAHPSSWPDPYENRFQHPKSHSLFAQCWCQSGISEAMWRIYSLGHRGVRISTTKEKLETEVKAWAQPKGYRWRGDEVRYLPQAEINAEMRQIERELRKEFTLSRAADVLYLKREAFNHEDEWRATLYYPDAPPPAKGKEALLGIAVDVNPHAMINNILLDPRASQEIVDEFTNYFKQRLSFAGTVQRSQLYKMPKPIVIDGEEL